MSSSGQSHSLLRSVAASGEVTIGRLDTPIYGVTSHAVLRGYMVWEYLITVNNLQPFFLRHHIVRLCNSSQRMAMGELPWSPEEIYQQVLEAVADYAQAERCPDGEAAIYLQVTSNPKRQSEPFGEQELLLQIGVRPRQPRDTELLRNGITVGVSDYSRPDAAIKHGNYTRMLRIMQSGGRELDFKEVVYFEDDVLREGARSMAGIVAGNSIFIPPADGAILQGITGHIISDILREELTEAGVTLERRDIGFDEWQRADVTFLAGSDRGIQPIARYYRVSETESGINISSDAIEFPPPSTSVVFSLLQQRFDEVESSFELEREAWPTPKLF